MPLKISRFRHWRWARCLLACLALLVVLAAGSYLLRRDNLHAVLAGEVYRSAQVSANTLRQIVYAKHIKTILNLRGPNRTQAWYRQELAVAHQLGIKHVDIALSAYRLPSTAKLKRLLAVLMHAGRPLLFHCQSGSDRTGLASMLVLLLQGESIAQAGRQLSWHYGVFSKRSVGYLVVSRYQAWLLKNHWHSSRLHLLQWAKQIHW
ncbi:MAG: tyrosine-protein phosphatase [Gammaproteobacteria bacterium]|nr:tyrosine-protein phosphatase [Gammaproteobacteria bacterium]